METSPSFDVLSEDERLAAYGALIAMAAADGDISEHEVVLLFGCLATDRLSDDGKQTLLSFFAEPPALADCLSQLQDTREEVRSGILLRLAEIAMVDDYVVRDERIALENARQQLGLQAEVEIDSFIQEVRRLRGEKPGTSATSSLQAALPLVVAIIVPAIAAVFALVLQQYAQIDLVNSLNALGFGYGLVPGLAIAVILGIGTHALVSRLLQVSGRSLSAEEQRRRSLLISNLQASIGDLSRRVEALEDDGRRKVLNQRLAFLQRLLARTRAQFAEG